MKKLLLILTLVLMGMNIHAQSDFISSSPVNEEDCFADLQGKGGILVLSELGDLAITINNVKAPQITPKGRVFKIRIKIWYKKRCYIGVSKLLIFNTLIYKIAL